MSKRDKLVHSGRAFLNKPTFNSNGNIYCSIMEQYNDYRNKGSKYPDFIGIEFGMADCTRTINLDFDTDSKGERDNAVYKAQVIIDVMTEFRDSMIETFKRFEDNEPLREKELEILEAKEKKKEKEKDNG